MNATLRIREIDGGKIRGIHDNIMRDVISTFPSRIHV